MEVRGTLRKWGILFFFSLKDFIDSFERERTQAGGVEEGEAGSPTLAREPYVGLHPRTLGS